MDLESDLNFEDACLQLEGLGLPVPDTPATQRVIGIGGDRCRSLQGITLEQLFDAVQSVQNEGEISRCETDLTTRVAPPRIDQEQKNPSTNTGSVFIQTSTINSDRSRTLEPNDATPSAPRDTGGTSAKRSNVVRTARSNKLGSYFREIPSERPGRNGKEDSMCLQCEYVVTGTENRNKLFHVILCCNIPFLVRLGFYFTTNDKDKPPLIEAPPRHCERHQARIMIRTQAESLKQLIEGYLSRRDDISRDQALARWFMAKAEIKMNTRIDECSSAEAKMMSDLLMDYIVEENVPFAVCGNRDGAPRPFGRLLSFARPGYQMPPINKIAGEMLDSYFQVVKKAVHRKVKNAIPNQCRVTIMFDGSEDVRGKPVINVLLRVMGSSRHSTKTYFLKSVYTGYDTCDSNYYVDMVEKVMEEHGGFASVAGVVTDNTGSVVNARDTLQERYPFLVASQDQAHVADLLMSDIGDIPWILECLQSVATIGTQLRRFRKLRQKLVELQEAHNTEVRSIIAKLRQSNTYQRRPGSKGNDGPTEDNSMALAVEQGQSEGCNREKEVGGKGGFEGEENMADVRDDEPSGTAVTEDSIGKIPREVTVDSILSPKVQAAVQTLRSGEVEDEDMVGAVVDQLTIMQDNDRASFAGDTPSFARMMRKVSSVRFASCEKLLFEYKSLRKLLLQLISDERFESFYPAKNARERTERDRKFVGPIIDEGLAQRVYQVHAIMRACRVYLRMFDSERSLISEVFKATNELERTIDDLPPECFPEPCEENHREIKEVFRNRKEGPLPGRKQVRIRLLCDLHVAAAMLDPYRCPHDITKHKHNLRNHLENYFSGSTEFQDELDKDEFIVEVMNQYDDVHELWRRKGYIREGSEGSSTAEKKESKGETSFRIFHERSPISWWTAGSLKLPGEGYQRRAAEALVECAIRTLSVSPTATATERTFSHLTRIQPLQRSGLSPEKVEKLLFCQWNLRVLRKVSNPYEVDLHSEYPKTDVGMKRLRDHRKRVSSQSFLNALRRAGQQTQPRRFEPTTAQNEPTDEQPEASPPRDWPIAPVLQLGRDGEAVAGAQLSPIVHMRDQSSGFTIKQILEAAVGAGYSIRDRQREETTGQMEGRASGSAKGVLVTQGHKRKGDKDVFDEHGNVDDKRKRME